MSTIKPQKTNQTSEANPGIPYKVEGDDPPGTTPQAGSNPDSRHHSAEGKALQRIQDIDDPSQWVTILGENEEIDLDELNESLKKLGYGAIAISDQEP